MKASLEVDRGPVVPSTKNATTQMPANQPVAVSTNANGTDADGIKSSIRSWQNKRWKCGAIMAARKAKGRVEIADLAETCETSELQPVMDILIADYVMLVNSVDAYAEADNEAEALAKFYSSLSMSDIAKVLEDSAQLARTLNDLRKGVGKFDFAKAKALASDAITIGKVTLNVGDVCGFAKGLLSQKP